ncbi:ArsR/SmtB family transcription factor [Ligilactobacillus sp. LYQ60]|uniref:ArsR/SmtB family transcription factor n=1 Tax=unclassified Ligilactobacillus TaxID=2767920 RepID=UPI003852F702
MVTIFKALADKTRVNIIKLIARDPGICGCEIAAKFKTTQGTISHHIRILVEAKLIIDTKEGRSHYYTLNVTAFEHINEFVDSLAILDKVQN